MSDQPERWDEVAAAVTAEMERRAWGQVDLVKASGVSSFTVRKVMRGEPGNYRPANLGRISRALWGDPNRLRAILEGSADVPGSEREDSGDEVPVVAAILADPWLNQTQKDMLILGYRTAIAGTAVEGGLSEHDRKLHGLP